MKGKEIIVIGTGNHVDTVQAAITERGLDITVVGINHESEELVNRMEKELQLHESLPSLTLKETYLEESRYPSGREKRRERRRKERLSK